MRLDQLLRVAGLLFEKEEVDYFIFGATAMSFWVPPRNTVDLDAVVSVERRRAGALFGKLRSAGFPAAQHLLRKFLEGRLIELPAGDTHLDLKWCRTRHDRSALSRAKRFEAEDYRLRIAVPEDLILFKLQAWKRQDQADVERLLTHRRDLDTRYIETWLRLLEEETGGPMRDRWAEFRGS